MRINKKYNTRIIIIILFTGSKILLNQWVRIKYIYINYNNKYARIIFFIYSHDNSYLSMEYNNWVPLVDHYYAYQYVLKKEVSKEVHR